MKTVSSVLPAVDLANKRMVFRVDASTDIGIGHVMRCLTLADALVLRGAHCEFICRMHPGHQSRLIAARGYRVHELPVMQVSEAQQQGQNDQYSRWLGASQAQDARACVELLGDVPVDWLIVDHYGLDIAWEKVLRASARHLLVFDDLANRDHDCDVLLDQTFGRDVADYQKRVPEHCMSLCGASYAVLRPDFQQFRPVSLKRRQSPALEHVLISLGGVDKANATGALLGALAQIERYDISRITVVMGASAPWLEDVRRLASNMPVQTDVKVNVQDMAQLMVEADLAIGAAGSTTWERCCLGLPSFMLVVADNQMFSAQQIAQSGAVQMLVLDETLPDQLSALLARASKEPDFLPGMSSRAREIVDGDGVQRVVLTIRELSGNRQMRALGTLRSIQDDELELMLAWRNAPSVRSNMYTRHVISLEEHLAWWQRARLRADQQYLMYEFNGVPCGIVGFTDIDDSNSTASWAFYADPEAPKGTGSRMEFLALEHAFDVRRLHKLSCEVLAFNSGVVRLHQKFAFTVEGVLRQQHRVNDEWVDIVCLGLLREEWASHRPSMLEKMNKITRG
ncbi:UDP-2,4-diacetamido-2,4,6-trideoxy-beta-L-altropyranose hydrolase [Pseudomonas sp. RW10S2]|uniref:UDP-2,4-diacetamido-2,4, 6-trideoxy-beta-L-altropyranose hydrolase n=1 Tax=Pseudomonas sp. RW10S2 TaxID=459637 RepID=UPI001EE19838|nr:UDP-2,4-diacetamido-2,4,6-trideoxy-beta-L-altropyranose hydrolase [Pseudomonas sp. RW10S2]